MNVYVYGVCVNVCVYSEARGVYAYMVCVCVNACVYSEARVAIYGSHSHFQPYFAGQGLSAHLESTDSAEQAEWHTPGILLSLSPQHWGYKHVPL